MYGLIAISIFYLRLHIFYRGMFDPTQVFQSTVTIDLQFPMKKLILNVKGIIRCAGTGWVTITAFVQDSLLKN